MSAPSLVDVSFFKSSILQIEKSTHLSQQALQLAVEWVTHQKPD